METLGNALLVGHGGALANGTRVGQEKPPRGRGLGSGGRGVFRAGCRRR